MKTLTLNGKKVKLYDDIEDLPIVNFQKFNKYLLIDAGIGSTADDIDQHIARIARYIKTQDQKNALQELQNMRQNMYMVINKISPRYLAFAALIHSIDGKLVEDLSDENLRAIIESLQSTKHSWLITLLEKIKKKVESDLGLYFPNDFVTAKDKELCDKLRRRALLVLDGIITSTEKAEEIDAIDNELFGLHKPKSFAGAKSIEIVYDKQFEATCFLITQKMGQDAKKMTTLQFYACLDNIRKQAETEAKNYKKINHHGRR